MTESNLEALLTRLIQYNDRLLAYPAVRSPYEILAFLFGVSGAFWMISRLLGYVAVKIHDVLDRSLATLFAVAYNIVLAVLFSAVLFYAILAEKGGGDLFWYQASGFVFLYLVLSAAYTDRTTGRIDEYGLLGYVAGLLSYLAFAFRTDWASHPLVQTAHGTVAWLRHSWASRLMVAYALFELGGDALYWALRRWPRLRKPYYRLTGRFFFDGNLHLIMGET